MAEKLTNVIAKRFKYVSTGSLKDIREAGIYYIAGSVTDKPIAGGGFYILGRQDAGNVGGLYVSLYTNEVFQIRLTTGAVTVYDRLTIETVQVSGTTSSTGAIGVPVDYQSKRFLNALLTTSFPGYVVRRDQMYFTVFNNDGTPKTETTVEFDAYFA